MFLRLKISSLNEGFFVVINTTPINFPILISLPSQLFGKGKFTRYNCHSQSSTYRGQVSASLSQLYPLQNRHFQVILTSKYAHGQFTLITPQHLKYQNAYTSFSYSPKPLRAIAYYYASTRSTLPNKNKNLVKSNPHNIFI